MLSDPERGLILEEPSDVDGLRDNGRVRLVESLPTLCTIDVIEEWCVFIFWEDNIEFLLVRISKLEGVLAKLELSEMASIIHVAIVLT